MKDIELVAVQPSEWVRPNLWSGPFFVHKGEARCLSCGLGAQCQRPLDHAGEHGHMGVFPDGQVLWSAWSNNDVSLQEVAL